MLKAPVTFVSATVLWNFDTAATPDTSCHSLARAIVPKLMVTFPTILSFLCLYNAAFSRHFFFHKKIQVLLRQINKLGKISNLNRQKSSSITKTQIDATRQHLSMTLLQFDYAKMVRLPVSENLGFSVGILTSPWPLLPQKINADIAQDIIC